MTFFTAEKKVNRKVYSYETRLFGRIAVFQQIVYTDCIRWFFMGIRYKKVPYLRFEKEYPVRKIEDRNWYVALLEGQKVEGLVPVPSNAIPPFPYKADIRIDLERAMELNPGVNRIALVFFMGIGDYFYATPFIEKLKRTWPDIPLVAYVSKKSDSNNSALVADCLQCNPNIEEVLRFNGVCCPESWKNYDYSEVVREEPETTLILPMIYDHESDTWSRDDALSDMFGLPRSPIVPRPRLYRVPDSEIADETFEKVRDVVSRKRLKGVVWIQFVARSTNYTFKNAEALAARLVEAGYCVVSVDPLDMDDEAVFVLDLARFRITDSIRLLQRIHEELTVYCLTVDSCFWSISAALDIPNLGIQFTLDTKIRTVYYPNIYVITHVQYDCVPRMLQFVAPPEAYETDSRCAFHYKPGYLYDCFCKMLDDLDGKQRNRPRTTTDH